MQNKANGINHCTENEFDKTNKLDEKCNTRIKKVI